METTEYAPFRYHTAEVDKCGTNILTNNNTDLTRDIFLKFCLKIVVLNSPFQLKTNVLQFVILVRTNETKTITTGTVNIFI